MTIREINQRAVNEFFHSYLADGAKVRCKSFIPARDPNTHETDYFSEWGAVFEIKYNDYCYYVGIYCGIIRAFTADYNRADMEVQRFVEASDMSDYIVEGEGNE